ncbi:hypothetical protein [Treponema sp.]|uniref:hypothetical protein n=1 Tax=Treponema sp. TaxID=166 RepID=UPI003F064643
MSGFFFKHKLSAAFFLCSFVFFSCGLDTFYYLEPPKTDGHTVKYTSDDRTQHFFSFLTNEKGDNADYDSSDFSFLGTEVYYKIYNNFSTMVSVQNAVDSLNSSSDVSAAAINLINSRGYKTLSFSSYSKTPLIPQTGTNRYVYIRLNSYNEGNENSLFTRIACYGSSAMNSYEPETPGLVVIGIPLRSTSSGSSYGFNFNKKSNSNPLPVSGDEDVNFSTSGSESGVWYVDMWAVSVGRDSNYSPSYSKVLHLGSIKIDESWYDDYSD